MSEKIDYSDGYEESLVTKMYIFRKLKVLDKVAELEREFDQITATNDWYIEEAYGSKKDAKVCSE